MKYYTMKECFDACGDDDTCASRVRRLPPAGDGSDEIVRVCNAADKHGGGVRRPVWVVATEPDRCWHVAGIVATVSASGHSRQGVRGQQT